MFLKNRNISSKIKRSKVTDYVALTSTGTGGFMLFYVREHMKAQPAVVLFKRLRGATKDWESRVSNWVRDKWFITVLLCFTF